MEQLTADKSNGDAIDPGASSADIAAAAALPFQASSCMRCDTGPALADLADFRATGNAAQLDQGVNTFNTLLESQTQPNGSLYDTPAGGDIDTMFFADNLGIAYILGGSNLSASTQTAWRTAVTNAADFLINNGNLAWYTNGNVTVGNALTMALAYQLSGSVKYKAAYHRALDFAINPDQHEWAGFGFITTRRASLPDGSDGAGYFAEKGATTPGYDPDYTMLQSEQLARLYLVTGDPKVLKLLNMEVNQLLERVDEHKWILDASNGSRRNGGTEYFDTSALTVLALRGGRSDLLSALSGQWATMDAEYLQRLTQPTYGDRFYYSLGMTFGTMVMAANTCDGLTVTLPVSCAPALLRMSAPRVVKAHRRPGITACLEAKRSGGHCEHRAGVAVSLWVRVGNRSFRRIAVRRTNSHGAVHFTGKKFAHTATYEVRSAAASTRPERKVRVKGLRHHRRH